MLRQSAVGVVEAVGSSVRGYSKGERVGFMPASATCRQSRLNHMNNLGAKRHFLFTDDCSECISGNHRFCEKKTSVGFKGPYGGFSQFCLADPQSTVKIPDGLTNET